MDGPVEPFQLVADRSKVADRSADRIAPSAELTSDSIFLFGLLTALGVNTFPIIRRLLEEIVLVEADQIRAATGTFSLRLASTHLVAEPSGAVTLAALQQDPSRFQRLNVVAVVSGDNLCFGNCRLRQPADGRQP